MATSGAFMVGKTFFSLRKTNSGLSQHKKRKTMNELLAVIALVFIGCVIASNNS